MGENALLITLSLTSLAAIAWVFGYVFRKDEKNIQRKDEDFSHDVFRPKENNQLENKKDESSENQV